MKAFAARGARRLLVRALGFTLRAHARQKRKGTELPYILHPLGAAATVIALGGDPEMAAAALLHDTVEDAGIGIPALRREFSPRVARLVAALSDDKSRPWRERKRLTLKRLGVVPRAVLAVAFADKLDNIRAIARDQQRLGDRVWSRFNQPRSELLWYYRKLAQAFGRRLKGADRTWSREFSGLVGEVFRTKAGR